MYIIFNNYYINPQYIVSFREHSLTETEIQTVNDLLIVEESIESVVNKLQCLEDISYKID